MTILEFSCSERHEQAVDAVLTRRYLRQRQIVGVSTPLLEIGQIGNDDIELFIIDLERWTTSLLGDVVLTIRVNGSNCSVLGRPRLCVSERLE